MTGLASLISSYPWEEARIKEGTNERKYKSVERWKFSFSLSLSLEQFSPPLPFPPLLLLPLFAPYRAEKETVERLVYFVHGILHLVSRYYLTTVVTSSPEFRYRLLCRYCAPEASGAKYKYKRLPDPAVGKSGVTLEVFASVIVANAEREAVYTR